MLQRASLSNFGLNKYPFFFQIKSLVKASQVQICLSTAGALLTVFPHPPFLLYGGKKYNVVGQEQGRIHVCIKGSSQSQLWQVSHTYDLDLFVIPLFISQDKTRRITPEYQLSERSDLFAGLGKASLQGSL